MFSYSLSQRTGPTAMSAKCLLPFSVAAAAAASSSCQTMVQWAVHTYTYSYGNARKMGCGPKTSVCTILLRVIVGKLMLISAGGNEGATKSLCFPQNSVFVLFCIVIFLIHCYFPLNRTSHTHSSQRNIEVLDHSFLVLFWARRVSVFFPSPLPHPPFPVCSAHPPARNRIKRTFLFPSHSNNPPLVLDAGRWG